MVSLVHFVSQTKADKKHQIEPNIAIDAVFCDNAQAVIGMIIYFRYIVQL